MTSPRVSVIIPVHNSESYLEQCLDSILSQTEKNIEVICVNDSSDDNSQQILDGYAQIDPRIILLKADCQCAGAARNLGLAQARGKYLSFLDSDDFFEPEMLQEVADSMDDTDSDVAIYGSWIYDTARGSNRQAKWNLRTELIPNKRVFSWRDMPNQIFNAFSNNPWNKMFRNQLIRDTGLLFQEISRTNDLYFTCVALIEAARITVIDKPFAHYRIDSTSSLQATNDREPDCFIRAHIKLDKYLISRDLQITLKRSFLNHLLDDVIHNLNSVHALESIGIIRDGILEQIEPRYQLLAQTIDFFDDNKQFEEYESLLTDDTSMYLFKRSQRLCVSREDMYWYANWLDWKLWQANEIVASQDTQLKEQRSIVAKLDAELAQIKASRSYRLAKQIAAPFRLLKGACSKRGA